MYYNDVRGLIGLGPAEGATSVPCTNAEGCVQYRNLGHVGTLGVEVELRRTYGRGGSLSLAYTYQRSRDLEAGPFVGAGSTPVLNSPEHIAQGRVVQPLVRDWLVLGGELIYSSPRVRRDGEETAHMLLGNLTLSGRIPRAALRWALGVYNVFDWRYGVPVGSEYAAQQLEVPQLGRTALGTIGASF
jgi:outer membrane receptor protein involved in Fe transport